MSAEKIEVGFLGVGNMGSAIAERLEGPEIQLHVFDPSPACVAPFAARGARIHSSARSVADTVSIVFASLPTSEISVKVGAEVAKGTALTHYVEMSTSGRDALMKIAASIGERAALIDAPVTGGPPSARAGTLTVMAAAKPEALSVVRPWLERIGNRLFIVGEEPGQAQMMKLVNQMTAATLIAATIEALAAGAKAGLDAKTMVAILDAGSGQSRTVSWLMPRYVLTGKFDFGAAIATMIKDLELALHEVAAMGTMSEVTSAGADLWRSASAKFGAQSDLTNIFRTAEISSGVRLFGTERDVIAP